MYWTTDLLEKHLQAKEGTPERELKEVDLLGLLTTYEMRLNRCDGMDPNMAFLEGTEMDERNYYIGDCAARFYKKYMPNSELYQMGYGVQGRGRQPIEGPSSKKEGKLLTTLFGEFDDDEGEK